MPSGKAPNGDLVGGIGAPSAGGVIDAASGGAIDAAAGGVAGAPPQAAITTHNSATANRLAGTPVFSPEMSIGTAFQWQGPRQTLLLKSGENLRQSRPDPEI
jgi:hypothetical protein